MVIFGCGWTTKAPPTPGFVLVSTHARIFSAPVPRFCLQRLEPRCLCGQTLCSARKVLTTYDTLASDYMSSGGDEAFGRAGDATGEDPLGVKRKRLHGVMSVDWHRVVLDEAHVIRNPSTRKHKVCALRGPVGSEIVARDLDKERGRRRLFLWRPERVCSIDAFDPRVGGRAFEMLMVIRGVRHHYIQGVGSSRMVVPWR